MWQMPDCANGSRSLSRTGSLASVDGASRFSGFSPCLFWSVWCPFRISRPFGRNWYDLFVVLFHLGPSHALKESVPGQAPLGGRSHPVLPPHHPRRSPRAPHPPPPTPHRQESTHDHDAVSPARPDPHTLLQVPHRQCLGLLLCRYGRCADHPYFVPRGRECAGYFGDCRG